jgi:aspartate aminotransferase
VKLAGRMARIAPSSTLAVKRAADEMRARGVDVVDFGPGEPDFPTPPHVVEAAVSSLRSGETHYTDTAGLPDLRRSLAAALGRRADRPIGPDELIVTCGGKSAIFYAVLALVEEGDEVVIPAPCWVSFPEQVRLAGGEPVFVPCRAADGFRPRIGELAAALTQRTRLLIVNSPCNPTGAVLSDSDWDGLAALARERHLIVLSDETYDAFDYRGAGPSSALSRAAAFESQLLVVNSFSKTHAMTGWRVGWAWGAAPLIHSMVTLQSQDATHPATFAQRAAIAALEGPAEPVARMREEYAARRELILAGLQRIPGFACAPPSGAFYVFPDVREAMERVGAPDDVVFARRLLEEAHVATVAGTAFNGPGHLRFSYALSRDRIGEGLRRIAAWLESAP